MIIPGGKDRSVDGLVWVNEPDQDLGDGRIVVGKSRLFSIGYTSTVTEWDLEKGVPKRHASGQHGDIWCMAAQPVAAVNTGSEEGQDSAKLIVGTIDGELVMYSIEDDDLRFQRVLLRSPHKKSQMVSITFQSRKIAIVGCADSTIRVYDIAKGHTLRRMTLGSDLVGGSKDIIVWSVKCLPGGNIVSGDSTGQVCIWDGKTYTQMQRMQSHKQDVLSLTTSSDGSSIFSGGMDRRTILYKQNTGAGQRWAKVWGRRYHEHDVKCMASFESGPLSVVVSGGPDANPVVIPLKEMGRENHRIMPSLPQQPPLLAAAKARFVVSWWEREVHIWTLRKSATDMFNEGGEDVDINQNRKLLKTIIVRGDSNITSATINEDGTLLVVSTSISVKAFRLQHQDPIQPVDIKLSTLQVPQKLANIGATKVQLSPNGQWLCAIQQGSRVVAAKIDNPTDVDAPITFQPQVRRLPRLRRKTPRYILNGGLGSYDRTITHAVFSADSKMIATSDLAGYIDTWVLRGSTEDMQNGAKTEGDASSSSESDSSEEEGDGPSTQSGDQWVRNPNAKLLPKLPTAATVLSFSNDVPETQGSVNQGPGERENANDYTLLAVTTSWNLLSFHPLQGSLTPWSRRHPRKALPAPVQDLLDLAKGVLWQGSRAWIYGVSFLLMIDMAQDLPKPALEAESSETPGKQGIKRKRTGPSTGAGGRMEQGSIAPSQVHKHTSGEWEDVDMDDGPQPEDINSDDEMAEADGELAQLRNRNEVGSDSQVATTGGERKSWWVTYKYRPIFGIVPLSMPNQPLEVALVERPTWDVEMPESYFGLEPWER